MAGATPPKPKVQPPTVLRRLLPGASPAVSSAPPSPAETAGRQTASPNPSPPAAAPPSRKKRHTNVVAACGACRRRKSKCNAERPCSVCLDRGTECVFDTNLTETHNQALKRKFSLLEGERAAYKQIYDVLRSAPEHEADEIFQRIRGGTDINTIVRLINYGDVHVQLALVPEAKYRYEFPYMSEMPASLLRASNPYLVSEIYDYVLNPKALLPASPSLSNPRAELHLEPYMKPFHAAGIQQTLLDTVKPSGWTSVSSDDGFLRNLLEAYFLHDYGWFTVFHKDLFLEDMASGRDRFCTPLLANAVLYLGCHCYSRLRDRAEYWNPKAVCYRFLAETKRLFEFESGLEKPEGSLSDPGWAQRYQHWLVRRLTTIQSAHILALGYALNGIDRIGFRYTLLAVEMAYEIQLFRQPPERLDAEAKCAWGFTAWTLFTWQSINCFYYCRNPLVRVPPETTLPDPLENSPWYGETWVRYPSSQSRLPMQHPFLFKAKAELWSIINEFSVFAFNRIDPRKIIPPPDVLPFYSRMVSWFNGLPEPLTPQKMAFPHQLMLHMQYLNLLMGILKPIRLVPDWGVDNQIPPPESPVEAYQNTLSCYETVIRLYYLRHGFQAPNSFLVNFLGTLAQVTLDAMAANKDANHSEHLRSTMLLTVKGLYEQGASHYVSKVVFRMFYSLMRKEDIQLFKRLTAINDEVSDDELNGPLKHPVQSDWPAYNSSYNEVARPLSSAVESLSLDPKGGPTGLSG